MISQVPLDVTGVVSVWLETLLYGMYCSLFFESLYVILKKKKAGSTPAKVFFGVTLLMFAAATGHIAINLHRLLRGYVWLAADPGPIAYFNDLGRWDNIAHYAIHAVMTWTGDFLVIYRCFIVWDTNYYIIALPAVLLVMSFIANSVTLYLFTQVRSGTIFSPTLIHWMDTIYALAFCQIVLTTGLLAYRLWRSDRAFLALGLRSPGTRSSLMPIIRIVIESAMIYIIEMLVLIILYTLGHNSLFIVQEAIVPSVGIVFTTISVRLAMRGSKTVMTTPVRTDETGGHWSGASHVPQPSPRIRRRTTVLPPLAQLAPPRLYA